jgi:uncharacterized protein YjbJ (UPF0337 family)
MIAAWPARVCGLFCFWRFGGITVGASSGPRWFDGGGSEFNANHGDGFAIVQTGATLGFSLVLRSENLPFRKRHIGMNMDQAKGVAKDIAGSEQEGTGKLVVSKEQAVKGLDHQISRDAEDNLGKAEAVVKGDVREERNAQTRSDARPTLRHRTCFPATAKIRFSGDSCAPP